MSGAREVRQGGWPAIRRPRWLRLSLDKRLAVLLVLLAMVAVGMGVFPSRSPAEPAKADSAAEAPTVVPPSTRRHRVIAYYFHGNVRCATCRAMEAHSREALESAFAKQFENGLLVWRAVNTDVKGNEHFVEDYKLYTKALVLVNEVRGKRAKWKNLEKIWQLVRDKDAFFRYVQDETRSYLLQGS